MRVTLWMSINWRLIKIFFSRTTGPVLNKLGTKHIWEQRIQVCSNTKPHHFPSGYNSDIVKIYWRLLQNHWPSGSREHKASLGEGISVLSKWRNTPFQRNDHRVVEKMHWPRGQLQRNILICRVMPVPQGRY